MSGVSHSFNLLHTCSMYKAFMGAQELPNFDGGAADSSRTFRRVLLNTCQEEFEGAANSREVC